MLSKNNTFRMVLLLLIITASCQNKSTPFNKIVPPVVTTDSQIPTDNQNNPPSIDPLNTTNDSTDTPVNTPTDIPNNTNVVDVDENQVGDTPDNTDTTPTGPIFQTVTDNFTQNKKPKVDILWVVDNSGSMGNEQISLAKHFDKFINKFISKEVQFQMAITTTDAGVSSNGRDGKDGTMICDWHKLTSVYAASNEKDFKAKFKKCINVGIEGSGEEQGLNSAERFLSRYNRNSGYAPFIREDAYFVAIIVSDEDDHNTKPVSQYMNSFAKAKNYRPGKVKVYSIINLKKTDLLSAYESIGTRYKKASLYTNSRYASIRSNFSVTLADFSDGILNLLTSFPLNKKPSQDVNHNSIIVKVNGVLTTKFTYNQTTNSISFWPGFIPAAESKIDVMYSVKK